MEQVQRRILTQGIANTPVIPPLTAHPVERDLLKQDPVVTNLISHQNETSTGTLMSASHC